MPVETMFLRSLDTVDGVIDVARSSRTGPVAVDFGAWHLSIEPADLDAFIGLIGRQLAEPTANLPPLVLERGEQLNVSTADGTRGAPDPDHHLWLGSGPVFARLTFGTMSQIVGALCGARHWARLQPSPAAPGKAVRPC